MPVWMALPVGLAFEFVFFFVLIGSAVIFAFLVLTRVAGRRPQLTPWQPGAPYPTILLHGYSQNAGNWFWFARRLRKHGIESTTTLSLWPMFASISEHARRLARCIDQVRADTGAPRVNIVAHSMGGLVSRWYLQEMNGTANVALLVTFGTPHRGTWAAYLGLGRCAREMQPGSRLLQALADTSALSPEATRIVSYYSNLDQLVMPSRSGAMGGSAEDRHVPFMGHTTFLFSPGLAADVAALLRDTPAEQAESSM